MAKNIWTVLCQDFVIDGDSRNLTLFQVLEQMVLVRQPEVADKTPDIIQFNMALVSLWTRSDPNKKESTSSRVLIRSPKGKTIYAYEYPVNLKETMRYRHCMRFASIGFAGFGRYEFIVKGKSPKGRWVTAATVPLEILKGETSADIAKSEH